MRRTTRSSVLRGVKNIAGLESTDQHPKLSDIAARTAWVAADIHEE
jgi:hypothetical protein